MRVVVIDYNGGNLASAEQAARRAANQLSLEAEIIISRQEADILGADRLILPGQGAFPDCARGLETDNIHALLEQSTQKGTPFLGICVGMQLMADYSLEHNKTNGLGWIKGHIAPMSAPASKGLRLPHMGWNELEFTPGRHPLTEGLAPGEHGYFVHSYALQDYDPSDIIATSQYGMLIPAIVARGCRCGTQFHVEKSQEVGLTILRNFLLWHPD